MNKKIVTIGIVVAIALGIVGIFTGGQTIQRVVNKSVGSVAGPDLYNPYFRFGNGDGIREWKTAIGLSTATTTVCSIASPAATSTLTSVGIKIDTSSSTASTIYIAKGSNTNATTTNFVTYGVAADAQAMINASSTVLQLNDKNIIAPNQFINFGMAGGIGTMSPSGSCHATFEEYLSL